jgi:hypothetical protein
LAGSLLQVLLPTIVAGISATVLVCQTVRRVVSSRRERGYQQLPTYTSALGVDTRDVDTDDDEDEFAEHLSLRHSLSRITFDHSHFEMDKPRAGRVAVIVEMLCVMGIIALQVARYAIIPEEKDWTTLVPVGVWLYTLGLVVMRLAFSSEEKNEFSELWDHTAWIYLFNTLFLVVPFRSVLIHPPSQLAMALTVAQFSLVCVLCIITVSVRKGNSVVVQEVVDGLEPSREPLASLFSLASFSWVDPIVWKGYWKSFTMEDIWNLRNDDVAANVLAAFRQTK